MNAVYTKNQRVWLWTAAILMFLTAAAHSLSFFVTPVSANDTERQLYDLLQNYRFDMGAGFHRSMQELMTALSACLPLLYVLGALTILYLARRQVGADVMRGVVRLQLLVFGVAFAVILVFAFLPPIVLTGLVVLALIFAERSFAGAVAPR